MDTIDFNKHDIDIFMNENADIGKVMQSGTVKREMLTEATFNQTNF
jgi:hypothetical protein